VAYKQQRFITHSSGGQEVQDQVQQIQYLVRAGFLIDLLAVSSYDGKSEEVFQGVFYKGTNAIMKAPPHNLITS
jgi:hypothetical protein